MSPQIDLRASRGAGGAAPPQRKHALAFTKADAVAFVLILLFGIAAVLFCERSADFLGDDVFYADCARSLLHHGYYGINGHLETNQPPGLTAILVPVLAVFGFSHTAFLRVMALFETVGLLVTYEVLRRHGSRLVAASVCVLLASSPIYFVWATRLIVTAYPFLFAAMGALLFSEECESASTRMGRFGWSIIFALAVAASLMIASAAMAFLGAIVMVVTMTAFKDRRLAWSRFWAFLPALLLGLLVQGIWMHRKPARLEWPLPGYPAPYLQQLKVKVGNYPELGMASLSDIPVRLATNILAQANLMALLVLRHGVSVTKVAVVVAPPLAILLGWAYSVWESGGMRILEWYFAGYEFIYLLWPWKLEARFFLPIAPLACFYVWQGMRGALAGARARPRVTACVWCPIALLLAVSGTRWIVSHWATGLGDLPDELLVPVYFLSAFVAAWMAYTGKVPALFASDGDAPKRDRKRGFVAVCRYAPWATIALLVCIGVKGQVAMAHENLSVAGMPLTEAAKQTGEPMSREIEAALWIRDHTALNSVVMARHLPTVYHYAERKLVWFPPTSDRKILLQGMVRHEVDYVVVIRHSSPYYLPDDNDCFDPLLATHVDMFHMVFQETDVKIFQVAKSRAREIAEREVTKEN
jgi:4-amino-4-deoxy-L-arabinose transferase-like glycosyltransferase